MKQKKSIFLTTNFLCFFVASSLAQGGLTVSAGSHVLISSGTVFSVDSLVLIPSASFTINGTNSETKDAVVMHPSANPHILRVYHLLNTLSPFSGDLMIYYQDPELNGIPENLLTLNVNDGSLWNAYSANTTRDASNNFVWVALLNNLVMNELTLANELAPLPVTFSSMNVNCLNTGELISWSTAQELNSNDFIIERSLDGSRWQKIGSVPAGSVNTIEHHYTFMDYTSPGRAFYRVAEQDINGRQTLSSIVTSSCSLTASFTVYPNPVGDMLNVNITATGTAALTLQLYDSKGSLIKTFQANLLQGVNQLAFTIVSLPAGTYLLNALWGNTHHTSQIVKQ